MSEILPVTAGPVCVSNDQRHDAALTIAEFCEFDPAETSHLLQITGLAQEDDAGLLHSIGTDEYEMPWFTSHR